MFTPRRRHLRRGIAALSSAVVLLGMATGGCDSSPTMALVSFRMCVGSAAGPQTLTIVTTNPDFIGEAEQALASGKTRVPIFDLLDGTGADPQWTWQVNPSTPTFADATVELCDGCPADVEANKAYWLSSVKRFCPWSAEVTRVEPIDSTG